MRRHPMVALLCYDPRKPLGLAGLDRRRRRGTANEEQRAREARVICRIHARRITLDAIHA